MLEQATTRILKLTRKEKNIIENFFNNFELTSMFIGEMYSSKGTVKDLAEIVTDPQGVPITLNFRKRDTTNLTLKRESEETLYMDEDTCVVDVCLEAKSESYILKSYRQLPIENVLVSGLAAYFRERYRGQIEEEKKASSSRTSWFEKFLDVFGEVRSWEDISKKLMEAFSKNEMDKILDEDEKQLGQEGA